MQEQQPTAQSASPEISEPAAGYTPPTEWDESNPRIGIAVSGGGVRSASFSFGALQALQQHRGLVHGPRHARFLSAVSGGSYIAAAMLMSLGGTLGTPSRCVPGRDWALRIVDGAVQLGTDGHPEFADARTADGQQSLWARLVSPLGDESGAWVSTRASEPLRPGSSESDYLRVHARYFLEGSRAWIVVRLLSLVLVAALTTTAIAVVAGRLSGAVWDAAHDAVGGQPALVALAAVGSVGLWLLVDSDVSRRKAAAGAVGAREGLLRDLQAILVCLAVGTGVALGYAAVENSLAGWSGASDAQALPSLLALGAGGTTLLGPSLIALVRAQVAPQALAGTRRSWLAGMVRRVLIVLVEIGLLVCVPLGLLTAFVIGWRDHPVPLPGTATVGPGTVAAVLLLLVGLVALLLGDSAISPHAFYRNRLARAFSMIRQHRRTPPQGFGQPEERARHRSVQPRLSSLNQPTLMPELLISASVNVTESGITAAGSNVRPIVFSPSAIYVAGDPGGGVATLDYETVIGRSRSLAAHSFDGTVMSYVALTGAAVSPSMGRYTKGWLRAVMTFLNLRLGAWIPNPASTHMADLCEEPALSKGLNRCPGPLLWLREFRGRHYLQSRYIYVSDGGHYENLGIVELIRRGCDEVWSIDASDDDPGTWKSLSESLNLIASELGCEISGDFSAFDLADTDAPSSRTINRPHTQVTLRGMRDEAPYEATIHVVKLGISADTNPVVTQLARKYRKFPYDSTLNQLYDAERFDLYRSLGFDSTSQALAAASAPQP